MCKLPRVFEPTNLAYFRHLGHRVPNYNERIFLRGFDRECVQSQNVSSHVGTWFDVFCEWWLSRSDTLVHLLLMFAWSGLFCGEDGLHSFQHLATVVVEDGNVSLGMESATSWYTAEFWSTTPAVLVSCTSFALLILRWGCREHFVSRCWHSSGRDCGRYPMEC